jgi:hypothetical protein
MLVVWWLVSVVMSYAASEASCTDWGFNAATLTCDKCDLFKQLVLADQVDIDSFLQQCTECCSAANSQDEEITLYEKAWIEICPMSHGRFPHIDEFISKKLVEYQPKLSKKVSQNLFFSELKNYIGDDWCSSLIVSGKARWSA